MGSKGCDLPIFAGSLKDPAAAWQKQRCKSQCILEGVSTRIKQIPKVAAPLQPLTLATLKPAPHRLNQRRGGKEGFAQRPSPLPSRAALPGHSGVRSRDVPTAASCLRDSLLGCHPETRRDTANCKYILC